MDSVQIKTEIRREKLAGGARLGYLGAFLVCVAFFVFFSISGRGMVQTVYLFGVCGFYQKTGLPCPGCFVTRSIEAFCRGEVLQSLWVQPVGFVICLLMMFGGLFSLLAAIRGIDYGLLRIIKSGKWIWSFIAGLILLLGIGWAVTLTRELIGS